MSDPERETEDYPEPEGEVESVDPDELARAIEDGEQVTLLDVRNRDEVDAWHIEGPTVEATHVPYMKFLSAEVRDAVGDLAGEVAGEEPVVVVCGRGEASAYVADLLGREGVDAYNLAGGMEGWARVYRSRPVEAYEGPGTLIQYRRPSSGCLAYLLASEGEAAVVDPLRAFADRYREDARERGADLTHAVDTHVHADHVSGVRAVAETSDATPLVPRGATDRGLADPEAFEFLADGDEPTVGAATLRAVHAPGHTTEMTALAVGNALVTGDSLFVESVARPDLEAGEEGAAELAEELHETLVGRFAQFDDGTVVAPGHYGPGAVPDDDGVYTARLGDLRERLGAFALNREAFVERVLSDLPPRPANHERIVAANLGIESVEGAEAFELELGPNNCAVGPSAAD